MRATLDTAKKSGWSISDGRRTVELDCGWYKGWICENVYGWHWHGPLNRYPYVDLIVLGYEPGPEEREQIKERFKDAIAPDGTKGMEYPI